MFERASSLSRLRRRMSSSSFTTGVLGQVSLPEHFGGTSKDIFQASAYVLNKFTTKNLGKPGRDGHSVGAELDEQLTAHIRDVVELYAADGASDEQRAIKLLPAYFGGLKVMHFDKAHACQRILSRTWPLPIPTSTS